MPTDNSKDPKEKIDRLAKDVMNIALNTLTMHLRFMNSAIHRLDLTPTEDGTFSTDGKHFFYNPISVLKSFKINKNLPARKYLHAVFHCIYRHMFSDKELDNKLWDLASDIAVEHIINDLHLQCLEVPQWDYQEQTVAELKNQGVKYITAEVIYRHLKDKQFDEETISDLEKLFKADDHSKWYENSEDGNGMSDLTGSKNKEDSEKSESAFGMSRDDLQSLWEDISKQVQVALETFEKSRGDKAGDLTASLMAVNREKYDYTSFLKQFAVTGEAMKINDDEFDYLFYTYGLSLYERMPLIEPLEYKDVKRIREFVIAIDTSGSTWIDNLVQKFIQKTYNILKQSESFFSKVNIHIIQCDADIQHIAKITSQEDFDEYMKTIKIYGGGGTDFRPIFSYVDTLVKEGEFSNLKGLILFTDGMGTFPNYQPKYRTAIVYVDDEYNNPYVPVWAIKLILQSEDI